MLHVVIEDIAALHLAYRRSLGNGVIDEGSVHGVKLAYERRNDGLLTQTRLMSYTSCSIRISMIREN